MRLLLATHNEHKRRELARLLVGHELELLPADVTLPPEEGEMFAENALGKARAAAEATGRVSIADDSGIEAAALGGAPGVRSARYAGMQASDGENLAKLLREVPAGSALAYVCALVYVDPRAGVERVFEGRCEGSMAAQPSGAGGFGYDPVFLPDDEDKRPRDESRRDEGRQDEGRRDEGRRDEGRRDEGRRDEGRRDEGRQDEGRQDEGRRDRSPLDESSQDGSPPAATRTRTMAELSDAQKDAISHRGRAARALLEWLTAG